MTIEDTSTTGFGNLLPVQTYEYDDLAVVMHTDSIPLRFVVNHGCSLDTTDSVSARTVAPNLPEAIRLREFARKSHHGSVAMGEREIVHVHTSITVSEIPNLDEQVHKIKRAAALAKLTDEDKEILGVS